MPELPEVEVTRRGILPHAQGKTVAKVKIHHPKLRLPIPNKIITRLQNQKISRIVRVGKYLLFHTAAGTLIFHLGMTGYLSLLSKTKSREKHDHFDLVFQDNTVLRYHDSRKFGLIRWTDTDPLRHHLLKAIGPDPLTNQFTGKYLYGKSRNRKIAVKPFIMDAKIVAGIGNIYACEALFAAGIHPATPAGKLSEKKCAGLVQAIKKVLRKAIETGTAIMVFQPDREWSGYFLQNRAVYQRAGAPCKNCGVLIEKIRMGQRSAFFCGKCQRQNV